MRTLRFGRKLTLPSTIDIKHQIRRLMFAHLNKEVDVEAAALGGQLRTKE